MSYEKLEDGPLDFVLILIILEYIYIQRQDKNYTLLAS